MNGILLHWLNFITLVYYNIDLHKIHKNLERKFLHSSVLNSCYQEAIIRFDLSLTFAVQKSKLFLQVILSYNLKLYLKNKQTESSVYYRQYN